MTLLREERNALQGLVLLFNGISVDRDVGREAKQTVKGKGQAEAWEAG